MWLSRHRSGAAVFVLGCSVGCGGLVRAEPDGGPESTSANGSGDLGSSSGSSSGASTGTKTSSGSGSGGASGLLPGDSGGIDLGCMGGDCTGGKVCCASVDFAAGLSVTSACAKAPCASGDYQFCTSSTECSSGTCGANPIGMGPMICSGGTGGGGLLGGH